jgi:hypothetical protein
MAAISHLPTAQPAPLARSRPGTATLTAIAFAAAGVVFLLYPALRPFSSEQGFEGARAFASDRWVLAHALAIVGFLLLALAAGGQYLRLRGSAGERPALWGAVLTWIGAGLTLPYYGAEAFGLHAVGETVIEHADPSLMSMVDRIRWEQGAWFILPGLLVLGIGVALTAAALWRSAQTARWSLVPLAAAFALYIPQYAAAQPLRVAHGALILLACLLAVRQLVRHETME